MSAGHYNWLYLLILPHSTSHVEKPEKKNADNEQNKKYWHWQDKKKCWHWQGTPCHHRYQNVTSYNLLLSIPTYQQRIRSRCDGKVFTAIDRVGVDCGRSVPQTSSCYWRASSSDKKGPSAHQWPRGILHAYVDTYCRRFDPIIQCMHLPSPKAHHALVHWHTKLADVLLQCIISQGTQDHTHTNGTRV